MTQHETPTSAITDESSTQGQTDELLGKHQQSAVHDVGETDTHRAENPSRVHWLFAPSRYERFGLLERSLEKGPGKGSADES